MQEKIEILLATYNGEKYIKQLLDSIVAQTYTNWIIRVGDDSSTDGTYDILLQYKDMYPEKFIIEKNVPGTGSAKVNFFQLMKKSTCKYVMCCDQDDIWLPHKIELTYHEMKKIEERDIPVLVHTDIKVVDADLNVMSNSFFDYSHYKRQFGYKDLLIQNFVTGCTMMMNRSLVQLVNLEEAYDNILMHDWIAALLAAGCGKIGFVHEPTMLYRQHSVNSVGAKQYGFKLFLQKLANQSLKKSVQNTARQAEQLAKTYALQLDEELVKLTKTYATIFDMNKIKRGYFCLKHGILKHGMARIICQLLFC